MDLTNLELSLQVGNVEFVESLAVNIAVSTRYKQGLDRGMPTLSIDKNIFSVQAFFTVKQSTQSNVIILWSHFPHNF